MKNRGLIGLVFFLSLTLWGAQAFGLDFKLHQLQNLPIKKVGLLLASAKGVGQSSFGHSYIRLSIHDFFSDDDITIEFVADDKGEKISILKGIGIGENYKFNVVLEGYKNVKYLHNIIEGRSLTTYPLILTEVQIKQLLQNISSSVDKIKSTEYSFFINNCSSLVEKSLDEILGLKGSLLPDLPGLLKSKYKNVINHNEVIVDEGAPILRERLVENKLPEILRNSQYYLYQNLSNHLKSLNETERVKAFLKLILVQQYIKLNKSELKILKIFLNLYALLEQKSTMLEMLSLVNMPNELKAKQFAMVSVLSDATKEELQLNSSDKITLLTDESFLTVESGVPILSIYYKEPVVDNINQGRMFKAQKKIDLRQFGFELIGQNLTLNREMISFNFNQKMFGKKDILLNALVSFELVVIEDKSFISPIVFIENELSKAGSNKSFDFDIENLISIPNFSFEGFGNCMSLVLTQKSLIEQAIFMPQDPPLSNEQNQELLKRAIEGKLIFVPGFKNIYDWTSSIGKNALEKIIGNFGKKFNIDGFGSLMWKYFTREKITEKLINDIKAVLDYGIPVPVRFKVEGKRIEHALLVYGIKEMDDRYLLKVYDPNTGLVDYSLGHGESIHTILKSNGKYYSPLYAKNGTLLYADVMNLENSLKFRQMRIRGDLEKIYNRSKIINKYDFDRF